MEIEYVVKATIKLIIQLMVLKYLMIFCLSRHLRFSSALEYGVIQLNL